ncbi:MAG: hypothetical protein AAFX50_13645, partial [Acidobacteriota bacterium]
MLSMLSFNRHGPFQDYSSETQVPSYELLENELGRVMEAVEQRGASQPNTSTEELVIVAYAQVESERSGLQV